VDQQRKGAVGLDDHVLAAPAHGRDPVAGQLRERRVERLQRVDARRCRRLDLGASQRTVEQACGDLYLRQLRHTPHFRRTRLAASALVR